MNLILALSLALFSALPAAAEDECAQVASDALKHATNTSCDLSTPQCRKHYYDKFLRECREAAYGKDKKPGAAPDEEKRKRNAKAQAYHEKAAASLRAGQPGKAIEHFGKALEQAPDNAELYYNRGMVYAKTGQSDKAISDLSRAIKLNPAVAGGNACVIRGGELFKKKDFNGAIADFTRVIKLTPGDARAYASRASAHSAKGDHKSAVADYSAAIKLEPANPKFFAARSQSYRKLGRTAEAKADENTLIRLSGE